MGARAALPRVRVAADSARAFLATALSAPLATLDAVSRHDLVVLRGRALVSAAARHGAFDGRLWSYLTDVPQSVPAVTPQAAEDLMKDMGLSAGDLVEVIALAMVIGVALCGVTSFLTLRRYLRV